MGINIGCIELHGDSSQLYISTWSDINLLTKIFVMVLKKFCRSNNKSKQRRSQPATRNGGTNSQKPARNHPGAKSQELATPTFEEIDSEVKFKKCSNLEDSCLGGDQSTILDSSF